MIQGAVGTREEAGGQMSGDVAAETLECRETVRRGSGWSALSEHEPRGIGPAPWDGWQGTAREETSTNIIQVRLELQGRCAVWTTKADASGVHGTTSVMVKERVFAPSVLGPDLWADIQAQHGPYVSDGRAGAHLAGSRQALNLGGAEPAGKGLGDCAWHSWGRWDCQAGPRETSWQARGLGHGQHHLTRRIPSSTSSKNRRLWRLPQLWRKLCKQNSAFRG